MRNEREEKEFNSKKYLIEMKGYKTCLSCGEPISPNDENYNISMCESCKEYQMRD
ncbi:hypothetical protein K4R64_01375 [Staphylococcus epidermidis]|nr:hypothetical protein [Staphylococcus epidermidis]